MWAARETASTSSTRSIAAHVDRDGRRRRSPTSRGSTPPTTLVPPPNGIAAAPWSAAQLSTASTSSAERGIGDQVGDVLELAAEAADHVAVGLAERARDAVVRVVREQVRRAARGAVSRGFGDLDLGRRAPAPRSRRPRTRAARGSPCRRLERGAVGLLVLVSPAPVLESALGDGHRRDPTAAAAATSPSRRESGSWSARVIERDQRRRARIRAGPRGRPWRGRPRRWSAPCRRSARSRRRRGPSSWWSTTYSPASGMSTRSKLTPLDVAVADLLVHRAPAAQVDGLAVRPRRSRGRRSRACPSSAPWSDPASK